MPPLTDYAETKGYSLRATLNHPECSSDSESVCSVTGIRFHHIRRANQAPFCVTRPNQIRLRCGSQVRISRLRHTDCSALRSIATCRTDNLHGELLSSH